MGGGAWWIWATRTEKKIGGLMVEMAKEFWKRYGGNKTKDKEACSVCGGGGEREFCRWKRENGGINQ